MAAPAFINELTAAGSLSAGAALVVFQNGDTFRTTPRAIITEAESFTASGSGAIPESVETALRKIKFSDSYATLQNAADAAAGGILVVRGTNTITAAVTLSSDTEVWFDPGALVQSATTSISLFQATSKTNIRIRGGHFKYTAAGSSGLIGGVEFNTCTHCIVEDCEFEGMQFAGPYAISSEYCTFQNNHIHSTQGTHLDAADITLLDDSNYNKVIGNKCLGTGAHGILVQGRGTGGSATQPLRNLISKNVLNNTKTTHGIVVYQVEAADTWNVVDGNLVEDIAGSGLSGASGNGIYIQTSGGCIVSNNVVKNCCTSTSSTTNVPAGISVAYGESPTILPCVVAGNHVDQPNYYGIAVAGTVAGTGATVTGNFVKYDDGTNGTGIRAINCSDISITGNNVRTGNAVATQAILVFAPNAATKNVTVTGNVVRGGNSNLLDIVATSGSITGVVVSGNTVCGGGASAAAILLRTVTNAVVSGNFAEGTTTGIEVTNGTNVRGSANRCTATTNAYTSGGTCLNVYFDSSNDFGSTSLVQNLAAGSNVAMRLDGEPATGNWQVGDEWIEKVPVSGATPGGYCTVAGNPGTWKNRANLA